MRRCVKALVLLLALLLPRVAQAQEKEYRYEIGGGAGVSWTYGDANPNALVGNSAMWAGLVWRYNLNLRWALATELQMSGLDEGRLWHVNVRPEIAFWNFGWGSDYREKRRYTPFLTAGLMGGVISGQADKASWTWGIPIGLGMKLKMTPRFNGQLTALFTKTFSDRPDGIVNPEGIKTSSAVGNDWIAALQFTLTFDFGERCVECHRAR